MKRRHRVNGRFLFKLITGIILPTLILSSVLYLLCVKLFTIRKIEVIGNNVAVSVDSDIVSHNLLFFPEDYYQKQIKRDYPQVQSVEFTKKYPDTLAITIVLRQPFVCVRNHNQTTVLDDNGRTIGYDISMCQNIPLIDYADQTESPDISLINQVIYLLRKTDLDMNIKRISINDGMVTMFLDKTMILFTQDKSTESVITTLQTLVRGFRMKGNMPSVIDLRFSKPIIKN